MRTAFVAVMLISLSAQAGSKKKGSRKHSAPGTVVLNGEKTAVVWSDGDSFRVKEGKWEGRGTRLAGYNTLEAFGPVHRWGDWTAKELYALAKASSAVAGAKEWTCTTDGKEDGYRRLLVTCPDLTVDIIRQGHALAYVVDGAAADEQVLAAQAEAMKARRGIWEKGVVNGVVTSVHSAGEADSKGGQAYNRVVDTRTGRALGRPHKQSYGTCEEVCEETDGDKSCMVYVPFELRYKHKPDCLR